MTETQPPRSPAPLPDTPEIRKAFDAYMDRLVPMMGRHVNVQRDSAPLANAQMALVWAVVEHDRAVRRAAASGGEREALEDRPRSTLTACLERVKQMRSHLSQWATEARASEAEQRMDGDFPTDPGNAPLWEVWGNWLADAAAFLEAQQTAALRASGERAGEVTP